MCHRHREQARSHSSSATVNILPACLARMEKQPSAVPTKSADMLGIQRVFSHRILGLPVGSGFFNLPAVAANSAAGLGTPMCKRRKCALHNVCLRAFDVCIPLWRLCAGDLLVCRVPFTPGSNLRTAATPSLGTEWSSFNP